jgi:hypothetical protein
MRRGSHDDYYPVVGFWRRVDLQADSNVSEKHAVSICRGCRMFLLNVGIELQIHAEPKPKTTTTYRLVPVLAPNYKQHILSPAKVRKVCY